LTDSESGRVGTDGGSRIARLCETGSAILETRDLQGILGIVTERSRDLFDGAGAAVAFFDGEALELIVVGASGSLAGVRGARYPFEGTLSEQAIREDRAVIANDVGDDPFYESLVLDPGQPRRVLAVPLRERAGAFGSLVVAGRAGSEGFRQDDADLMYAFGHLAGLAIQNARLLEAETARAELSDTLRADTEDHVTVLEDLHAAEIAVASDLELDSVLQTVTDKARELTSAAYGALGVLNPEGDELERFITSGMDEANQERMSGPPRGLGLLGAVTRSSDAIRVADVSADPRSAGIPGGHPNMTSFLGVPIRIGDRPIGNLYLTNKAGGTAFTGRDETIVACSTSFGRPSSNGIGSTRSSTTICAMRAAGS
jgi:GAF domain-containing protein